MKINLPNKLTLFRLALVPILIVLLYFDLFWTYLAALVVFLTGVVTDYYDGKLARRHNLVTNFGKLFDPVADKVLICAAFVMFLRIDALKFPAWAVIVVVAREFIIMGLRALAASEGQVIGAERWGKVKAGWQMACVITAISLMMIRSVMIVLDRAGYFNADTFLGYYDTSMRLIVWALIIVVVYLTVSSGISHLRKNRDFFFKPGAM